MLCKERKGRKMNIKYKGATEGKARQAVISYSKDEEIKVERFSIMLERMGYNASFRYGVSSMTIEVEDPEDYAYVKEMYLAFKNYDVSERLDLYKDLLKKYVAGIITEYGLYEAVTTDLDFYLMMVKEGHDDDGIKRHMVDVSGAEDAYYNALDEYIEKIA